jgi:hypothetical protein
VGAEGSDEAVFAEFAAIFVEGFCDAVRIEGEGVAGAEGALADFAIPFFENAEDGSGAFQGAPFSPEACVREDGIGIGLTRHTFARTTICRSDGVRV